MKLDDLKEQKIMSTEIKKLNTLINLLCITTCMVIFSIWIQCSAIFNINKHAAISVTVDDIESLKQEIKDVKNAVHFRYFNLTNSLEDIHNVKLETHYGHLTK